MRALPFLSLVAIAGALFAGSPPAAAQPAQPVAPRIQHATGALPEDETRLRSLPLPPTYRGYLPAKTDLSRFFPTPGDQGSQQSCVGWAVGYAARAYYSFTHDGKPAGRLSSIPSPAYIYNSIVQQAGRCNVGSSIDAAFDLLRSGSLSLSAFPYAQSSCRRPTAQERSNATDFRIASWGRLNHLDLDSVKAALAGGNPVVIRWRTRADFSDLSGKRIYRASGPAIEGNYHAMTLVGYDETLQAFRLINSWGTGWGDGGFGWVSYSSFRSEVRGAFVMRPAGQAVAPPPEPEPIPQPIQPVPVPPGPTVRPPPPVPPPPPPLPKITGVECGIVIARRDDAGLHILGFVGSQAEYAKVKKQADDLKAATFTVLIRPWPQCEALMTLEKGLLAKDRPMVRVVHDKPTEPLVAGSNFLIEVESPSYPSFLQVAYVQADGSVINLVQPDAILLKTLAPRTKLTMGDGRDGGPTFSVVPPFGNEIVIAIATRSPLFSDRLPQKQTDREFLTALRRAVMARPDSSMPLRELGASYEAFETKAQ